MTLDEFRATVKKWVQARNDNRAILADHFGVGMYTVDRWWLGTANPHPKVQEQIVEYIRDHEDNVR